MSRPYETGDSSAPQDTPVRAVMRWVAAVVFVVAGIGHFWIPDTLVRMTPDWVPFPRFVILATGAFEFAAAAALLTRRWRWWAGVALAAYTIAVWPANFKHAMTGLDLPYISNSWLYHGPRLAFQPVIAWWVLYCAGVIDWPWNRR